MNLIIISHRRSGTHLTIDSINNNFSHFDKQGKGYLILDHNVDDNFVEFEKKIENQNFIIKTHMLPFFDWYHSDKQQVEALRRIFENNHKIYVLRNGLDTLVSLYFYVKFYDKQYEKMSFSEFLKTYDNFEPSEKPMIRSQFWAFHFNSWHNFLKNDPKSLFIKYEDWLSDYEGTLKRIESFLNLKLNKKITDIRIKNSKIKNHKIANLIFSLKKKIYPIFGKKFTAVLPRQGKSQSFQDVFKKQDYNLIVDEAWKILQNEYGLKKQDFIN